ncbi:hypothetical protein Q1695_006678 [Nippostrongylus brasiliensis]|nr:hypothetical protein Q1695_006678 [Nippostrongylus brasiliensis]
MNLVLGEMEDFEEAIRTAREMTDRSETLILVTADHAHAFTLPGYLNVNQSLLENFDDPGGDSVVPAMFFATGPGYRGGFAKSQINGNLNDLHYRQPSAIKMKFGYHGGEDVGIWADGPYAHLFSGTIENTEVAYTIKYLLCLGRTEDTVCGSKEHNYSKLQDLLGLLNSIDPPVFAVIVVLVCAAITITCIFIVILIACISKTGKNGRDEESSGSYE